MRGEIEVQVREMLLQRGEDYFAWPNSPWEVASEPEVLVSGMVAPNWPRVNWRGRLGSRYS